MKFTHDFQADLATLMHEAEHGEPFAFVRFCDGEHAIMENKEIRTADGWKVGNEWMRKAMTKALHARLPRYFKGIACPCCWPDGSAWYRQRLGAAHGNSNEVTTTYSNLFVNGNYDTALPWLRGLARNWCVVSSAWGSDIRVPADWSKITDLPHYVIRTAEWMRMRQQPMLVAAGPLGKVLIHTYWYISRNDSDRNRRHTILDIGSALDPDLFGRETRNYHKPNHPNRKKICTWEPKTPEADLTQPPSTPQIVIRDASVAW